MIRAFHKSHLWMGAPSSLRKLRQIFCRKINLTPRRLDRTGCGQSGLLVFRSGHVTEWILRGNVAARCPGPHPAPAAAKGKIGTGSALSPNYNEFCAEPRRVTGLSASFQRRENGGSGYFPRETSGARANWQGYTFPLASTFATRSPALHPPLSEVRRSRASARSGELSRSMEWIKWMQSCGASTVRNSIWSGGVSCAARYRRVSTCVTSPALSSDGSAASLPLPQGTSQYRQNRDAPRSRESLQGARVRPGSLW